MKQLFCLIASLVFLTEAQAQSTPAFWNDILAFKKQDSLTPPPTRPILLIGSSSFTRWTDVQSYFPGYTILNRGFGGATIPDLTRYFYDIAFPYRPKQVLIYCGENDLASSDSITPLAIFCRVRTLFGMLRTNFPDAQISYVSIKPSPVRAAIQPRVLAANRMIRKYFRKQKNAAFIDVYTPMLDNEGAMREELYVADRLHMKPEGYLIWQRIITPYLLH